MGQKILKPQKIINQYTKNLEDKIKIDQVILFGSYAQGNQRHDSDLDIIILSSDFKKMPFIKRLEFLSLARKGLSARVPMDIIGYTPEEYQKIDKQSVIMRSAKKQAVRI